MLDFLERMRQKPEAVRAQFVFVVSAGVTGVIFLIWLSVVGIRFTSVAEPDSPARGFTESTFEEADRTVRDAIEKAQAEYEAFQKSFVSGGSTTTTDLSQTAATTTAPTAESPASF